MIIINITKESFPTSKLNPTKKTSLSITEPGTYILQEDIIVGSSSAGDKCNFLDFDRQVGPPPFHFGVWSIISIECDDVILDLNRYKLAMTNNFAMQQRFFSLIELANQPFIKGVAGFTADIKPANNITIKNGELTNSSHHCIHGNLNKNVYLENLRISDFEIAGIAINTGYNINIKNTKINGTSTKIKVLATFAMIQDLKDSLKEILNSEKYSEYHKLAQQYLTHEVLEHILDNPGNDDYNITINPMVDDNQVLDGNLFGIYFNNVFSVNELTSSGKKTNKINLDNVSIKNIIGNIQEVIGISHNDVCYKDNKGYLIRWDYIFNKDGHIKNMRSKSDKARLYLVKLQLFCLKVFTNKTTVLEQIINYNDLNSTVNTDKTNIDMDVYSIGGTDARGHIAKGNFGLRIDGASDVNINNIHIHNVKNYGEKGIYSEKTVYSEYPIGLDYNCNKVYKGNGVTGLSLSHCDDVNITDSKICKCTSYNGFVMGFGLFNNTYKCNINNLEINDLQVKNDFETEYPNLKPTVYNGFIDPTSYYNTIVLCDNKEIEDVDKSNKLLYNCGECDKLHKLDK